MGSFNMKMNDILVGMVELQLFGAVKWERA